MSILLICLLSLMTVNVQAVENQAGTKQVLLLMSDHASKAKAELLTSLAKDQPFELKIARAKGKSVPEITKLWGKADLVLLDSISPTLSASMFSRYQPLLEQFPQVPVVNLGDPKNKAINQGLPPTQQQRVVSYHDNAGRLNYRNLMLYLASQVFGLSDMLAAAPIPVPETGLYHPDFPGLMTDDEAAFFSKVKADEGQPLVAVAIHRSIVDYEERQVVDAMIRGIEKKGAAAFGFFFEVNDQALGYSELLRDKTGAIRPDLIINYRSLHSIEERRNEFEKLNVPVILALNYAEGDAQTFAADNSGISPTQIAFYLVIPEATGAIDPQIIAATGDDHKTVMPAQLHALVERAYNHARLAKIPNRDKKLAVFIWNYPPGERSIGAAFLDVPSSIEEIMKALKGNGYKVEVPEPKQLTGKAHALLRPFYRGEDISVLIDQGLAGFLPVDTYLDWFNALPEAVQKPIVDYWGKPAESHLVVEHEGQLQFVIPRIKLGNAIVLPQGLRGETLDKHIANYHSAKIPVNHAYLAFYLYTRTVFGADAIIHLGTHGSQEWLPGKERGLSVYDSPSLVVGNLPVFYPYIIDNVGEAMQAKRRGRATTISYLTPGFAKAGLYAGTARLKELLGNYRQLLKGQTRANTRGEIVDLASQLNILKEIGLTKEQFLKQFDQHLSDVHDYLEVLADMSQPLGVHTFGLLPKDSHLYSTLLQILGEDFTGLAATYEAEHGLALSEAQQTGKNGATRLEALKGFQLLKAHRGGATLDDLPEPLEAGLAKADTLWKKFQGITEIENLIRALEGQYIPVSFGGDPIRNPDAAPTGRNLIGFNPSKIPTRAAWKAGVKVMKQTLADYVEKHGRYPQKLAFSLWSLETMRHHGILEAQILYALGVKPKWNEQGQVIGTEVIPYSELKRPRVDAVISVTGLYRDAFSNVMLWMAEAIDKIAQMKAEYNFVYQHAKKLKTELLAAGKPEQEAAYLSSVRIFSNESGAYGTGLPGMTLNSGSWDNEGLLAEIYLARMGFAYGKNESRWGEDVSPIKLYGRVLSGTDGVIFSRSTNLYALMTNDDPFQYFGGIGLAVRHLDGKTPAMYVSNLRRADNIKSQTLEEFINQEFRSRYFHPRWIRAMQEAGYAGTNVILDRMNSIWGWEVMTPEAIRDDHWQEFFNVYIKDKYQLDIKAFFEKHNPDALAQVLERMLEAVRKGYWPADKATLERMIKEYTDLAARYDIFTDNQTFKDFVSAKAAGFGLTPLSAPAQAAAQQTATNGANTATQQVTGQVLKQVKPTEPESRQYWFLLVFILVFAAGFAWPHLRPLRNAYST